MTSCGAGWDGRTRILNPNLRPVQSRKYVHFLGLHRPSYCRHLVLCFCLYPSQFASSMGFIQHFFSCQHAIDAATCIHGGIERFQAAVCVARVRPREHCGVAPADLRHDPQTPCDGVHVGPTTPRRARLGPRLQTNRRVRELQRVC
jgi:hypothetical protein